MTTRQRLKRLVDAGVDCFLDLTEPGEFPAYEKLAATDTGRPRRHLPAAADT